MAETIGDIQKKMADEHKDQCTYCDHHTWSDHQSFHICIIDGGDSGAHEEVKCGATCKLDPKRFKYTRYQNVKK